MKPLLSILLCSLAAFHAQARLGETQQEIEARYGKPISEVEVAHGGNVKAEKREYLYSGLKVTVEFLEGKSQMEMVQVLPRIEGVPESNYLTDVQAKAVLDGNCRGKAWIVDGKHSDGTTKLWTLTVGGKEVAYANLSNNVIQLFTSDYKQLCAKPQD